MDKYNRSNMSPHRQCANTCIWKKGVGEKGVKSHRGKKSQALLTPLLCANCQADVIILDILLRVSSGEKSFGAPNSK